MNSLQFLSHLIELYGLYAVFVLAMLEGDITLLLAGVLLRPGGRLAILFTVFASIAALSRVWNG